LQSQRDIDVLAHLEIIFKQANSLFRLIMSSGSRRRPVISSEFLEYFQRTHGRLAKPSKRADPRQTN
jgi:hypothetical protein